MFSRVFKGGIMQTQVFSEYLVYCPILGTDTTYDQKTPLVGDRGLLYYSVFVFKAYGLFTYYVSQKLGSLHPPLPPSSAMVSIWLTPPPPSVINGQHLAYPPSPLVSLRQHFPAGPIVLQFST